MLMDNARTGKVTRSAMRYSFRNTEPMIAIQGIYSE